MKIASVRENDASIQNFKYIDYMLSKLNHVFISFLRGDQSLRRDERDGEPESEPIIFLPPVKPFCTPVIITSRTRSLRLWNLLCCKQQRVRLQIWGYFGHAVQVLSAQSRTWCMNRPEHVLGRENESEGDFLSHTEFCPYLWSLWTRPSWLPEPEN